MLVELLLILPSSEESEAKVIEVLFFPDLGKKLLDSLLNEELLSEESARLTVSSL